MKNFILFLAAILIFSSSWAQLSPTLEDVWIPMRDGEELQADVYIPEGVTSGEVVLIQTPYNKNLFRLVGLPMGVKYDLDEQPFIWVVADWRGFYGSSGADVSDFERGEDGYDICEWIVDQSWHGSRIGTWGPSALGNVQFATAREHHPNHTCAVPIVANTHQSYDAYYYGGVLEEARLFQLDALGYGLSPIVLGNPYQNALWNFAAAGSWYPSEIEIPTLQIGGWYDHNIDKMMSYYADVRNLAPVDVQDEQWLLVGPWVHGGTGVAVVGSEIQGELTYPNAEFKSDTMAWDFLNYYLLDADNGWNETPLITYYEMGGNDTWHTSDADDISTASTDLLFLNDEGKLGESNGVGSTGFICDPDNPAPTIGGATLGEDMDQGPYDQNELDSRTDNLTFKTPTLISEAAITGRVTVKLFVQSDQPDGDIVVRLTDLYPDGRSMLITEGIHRLRFRGGEFGEDDEAFMEPDGIYEVNVTLPFTNYTWLPGHAIKIYVGGNHSPRFNVNLQDGGEMYVDGDANTANITIHHNATYPSAVEFPGDNDFIGISEFERSLEIYPNPVQTELFIHENLASFQIYDLLGNQVVIESENNVIDVSGLTSGVYIINATTLQGEVVSQKFTKL